MCDDALEKWERELAYLDGGGFSVTQLYRDAVSTALSIRDYPPQKKHRPVWCFSATEGGIKGRSSLERNECTFCKGGIPKPDMIVPQTGDNTCGSIQLLAVKDYNGTNTCEIIRKQENVCCPRPGH